MIWQNDFYLAIPISASKLEIIRIKIPSYYGIQLHNSLQIYVKNYVMEYLILQNSRKIMFRERNKFSSRINLDRIVWNGIFIS